MLKKALLVAAALPASAQAQYYGGYGRLYGGQGYYERPYPLPYRIDYPLFFQGYYQSSPYQMYAPPCEQPYQPIPQPVEVELTPVH